MAYGERVNGVEKSEWIIAKIDNEMRFKTFIPHSVDIIGQYAKYFRGSSCMMMMRIARLLLLSHCQLSISSKPHFLFYAVLKLAEEFIIVNSRCVCARRREHSFDALHIHLWFCTHWPENTIYIYNIQFSVECWQRCGLRYCNFCWLTACRTNETGKTSKPHHFPYEFVLSIDVLNRLSHCAFETASLATTLRSGYMGQWAAQGFEGNLRMLRSRISILMSNCKLSILISPHTHRLSMALLKYTKERIPKLTHIRCFGTTKSFRTRHSTRSWKRKASLTFTYVDSPMMFASVSWIVAHCGFCSYWMANRQRDWFVHFFDTFSLISRCQARQR